MAAIINSAEANPWYRRVAMLLPVLLLTRTAESNPWYRRVGDAAAAAAATTRRNPTHDTAELAMLLPLLLPKSAVSRDCRRLPSQEQRNSKPIIMRVIQEKWIKFRVKMTLESWLMIHSTAGQSAGWRIIAGILSSWLPAPCDAYLI